MVEVARLESVYRFIAYPGFESPSLRQEHKCEKSHPRVAFLHLFHAERSKAPAGLAPGFEGLAPAGACLPNRHFAAATRQRRGPRARDACVA